MNTKNKLSDKNMFGRRGFLKSSIFASSATIFGSLRIEATESKNTNALSQQNLAARISKMRTLGSGKASMEVSAMGFGCMGMTYNRSWHPDKKDCIKLIRNAVERGVTLFDTAIIYGPLSNEILAGEALKPFKGKVALTTKFGHEVVNGKATGRQNSRPETIKRYCDDSLKRLNLDCIELFYQHRFDKDVPIEDVAGTIRELMDAGKIRNWGLCEVSADTIRKAHSCNPLTRYRANITLCGARWKKMEF